jgi:succinoglycan biosynthesis transport protein ExoP
VVNPKSQTPETDGGTLEALSWAIRALWKRWPIIVATLLIGGGIALAYSKSLAPTYEAATLIEFDPDVIKPLGNKTDTMVGWGTWDSTQYYETQYQLIRSYRVLGAVARSLGLQNDAEFLGYKPTAPVPMENVVAALRGRLTVDPVKASRLVLIRMKDTKPAMARRLADAVAKEYIAHNLEKMVSATSDTAVWISGQLDHFKHELEENENSLHEFKRNNDLPSSTLDDLSKMIRMEMQEYDAALTHTRLRRQELAARNTSSRRSRPTSPIRSPPRSSWPTARSAA